MMHGKTFKIMLTVVVVIGVAFAAPQGDNNELNNEVAGGFINKKDDSVSASWGGFHASASLNDDGSAVASAGGNGLGASSGYGVGGVGAGAGLFGTAASSGVGSTGASVKPTGGKPSNAGGSQLYHQGAGTGNSFFDRIFAIPINVLQSVNTYLNQKQQSQGHPGAPHGHPTVNNNGGASIEASATASSTSYAGASSASYSGANKSPEANVGDYGHGSATVTAGNGKPGSPMMIPITALRSVQNLLNG